MGRVARRLQRSIQTISTPTSTLSQQNSGTWTGTSFTATLSAGSTTTSTLVLIIAGNTTITTPAGWSLRTSQVNWMGHYVYTITSTTASSWNITSANGRGTWWIGEITHSSYDTSTSANDTNGNTTYVTPSITPTSGNRVLIASIASINDSPTARTVSGWTNSFSEVADVCSAGDDYPMQGVALRTATVNGTTAYSTSGTFSSSSIGRSAVICSLAAAGISGSADTSNPTIPANLVAVPSSNSADLSWTASMDNIGVAGYEYSLDGVTYQNVTSGTTSFTLNGLTPSTSYTIRVRARDAAGNRSTPATVNTTTTSAGSLSLSRVAWEGGSAYWAQFPKAAAAGWTDPGFFPMMSFSNSFSSDAEVAWDKDHGINVYHGLNPYSPYDLLLNHDMHYVGDSYTYLGNNQKMPDDFPNWVGYNMPDEIDGTSVNGQAAVNTVTTMSDDYRALNDGRMITANYTQMTLQPSFGQYSDQLYNYQNIDAVSIDMYWYTIPNSSYGVNYISAVNGPTTPRTATSYGAMVRGMRQINAAGPKMKPMWMFVECLSGSPGEQYVRDIAPLELKGAVMSSIIAEARGIMWFNNVASQGYEVGNVLRQAQVNGTNFRGYNQVQAMKEVCAQVRLLAPIINSQSYVWSFGSNLETMLKAYNGFVYIFAMCANGSTSGSRTFTLPTGVNGTSVEVIGESRTLTVSGGAFTDTFAAEYSYHIYKIAL